MKLMTSNEIENIESRMMLRNLHLVERCTFYGLDQKSMYNGIFILHFFLN